MYRDFHSATAIGDLMLIFGGRSDTSSYNHMLAQTEFYTDKLSYLVSYISTKEDSLYWNLSPSNTRTQRPKFGTVRLLLATNPSDDDLILPCTWTASVCSSLAGSTGGVKSTTMTSGC